MRLVLVGPPGSDVASVAAIAAAQFGTPTISAYAGVRQICPCYLCDTGVDVVKSRAMSLTIPSLREQRIEAAAIVLVLPGVDGAKTLAAQDAGTGEFVSIPGPPAPEARRTGATPPSVRPLALAYDGSRILFDMPEIGGMSIVVHTLATESNLSIANARGETYTCAAFAPDGRAIATLAQDRANALLDIVDLATGARRRLWSGDGTASVDPAIAWSPDGRYVAVQYLTPEDSFTTIVLGRDGTVAARFDEMEMFTSTNCAWMGDHELLLCYEYWEGSQSPIVLVDVETNARREFTATQPGGCLGSVNGRLLHRVRDVGIVMTDVDGSSPQPFLTITPRRDIRFFDIAPGVINTPNDVVESLG